MKRWIKKNIIAVLSVILNIVLALYSYNNDQELKREKKVNAVKSLIYTTCNNKIGFAEIKKIDDLLKELVRIENEDDIEQVKRKNINIEVKNEIFNSFFHAMELEQLSEVKDEHFNEKSLKLSQVLIEFMDSTQIINEREFEILKKTIENLS